MLQISHLQKTRNCTHQSQNLQLDGSKINRWKSSSFPSNTSSPSYFMSTMLGLIQQLTILLALNTAANPKPTASTQPQAEGWHHSKAAWVERADLESTPPVLWWVISTGDSNPKIQILWSTLRCLFQRPTLAVLPTDRNYHKGGNEGQG